MREQIRSEIRSGVFDYAAWFPDSPRAGRSQAPTFRELADRWLDLQTHLAKSTVTSYRKKLNGYFVPALGDERINTITHSRLAEVVASVPWGSAKTRNNALTPLRGMFDLAIRDGLLTRNPAEGIKPARVQAPDPDPLELDEVEAVLGGLDGAYRNYFETAFFTGLRPSELIALRWTDIDFRRGLIRVERARVEGETKVTKTAQVRDVEMNSRAAGAIQRQRPLTQLADGEIFLDPITGRPFVNDKPPRLVWDRTLRKAGVRRRVAYQARHTFATLNLMAGANPMWVAQQMGHSNMQMLLTRYSRWIQGADQSRERDKLEATLSGTDVGRDLGHGRGTGGD